MNSGSYRIARFPWIVCLIFCCSCNRAKPNQPVKFQQYQVAGEVLYTKHCANCHQKNGKGLGLLYPPLDHADYLEKNFEDVICLMKYGKHGDVLVNGERFNQPMAGVPSLTELEIAEIATYLYNNWGRERGLIELSQVRQALQQCAP